MDLPKVSIIIPIYNSANYIEKCIKSILSQTFQDFELLLIDDASTDGSLQRALALLQTSSIQYRYFIQAANAGQSAARNVGLEVAQGTYLCFIDSDDWVIADMLEKMLAVATSTQAEIVAGNKVLLLHGQREPFHKVIKSAEIISGKQALYNMFMGENAVPTDNVCTKLYTKALFDRHHIRFREGRYFEDFIASLQLFYHADKVALLPHDIYFHNLHHHSTTLSTSKKHLEDYIGLLPELLAFSMDKQLDLPALISRFNILSAFSTKRVFLFPHLTLTERYAYQQQVLAHYREAQEQYEDLKPYTIIHKIVFNPIFYRSKWHFSVLFYAVRFFQKFTSNPLYAL